MRLIFTHLICLNFSWFVVFLNFFLIKLLFRHLPHPQCADMKYGKQLASFKTTKIYLASDMLTDISSYFARPLLSHQTVLRKCQMQVSNLRLPTCKDGTLPTELIRHIGCETHIKIYVYISQKLFRNRFIWLALTNHEISSYRSKLDGNGLLTRRLNTCLIGSQPSTPLMFLCQS